MKWKEKSDEDRGDRIRTGDRHAVMRERDRCLGKREERRFREKNERLCISTNAFTN